MIATAVAHIDPPLAFECPSQPPIFVVLRRPVESAQFTSMAFTRVLRDNEIAISKDSRGSWRDNVFVERFWRSIKYEGFT